jgi:hypothetical protein
MKIILFIMNSYAISSVRWSHMAAEAAAGVAEEEEA